MMAAKQLLERELFPGDESRQQLGIGALSRGVPALPLAPESHGRTLTNARAVEHFTPTRGALR
ncbi:hypothetical protein MSHO_06740 [Mycobacterium shottsii]|uniref:Uncharacterized protein n=1 Tax=Mycobacterium shottsii TaxID=133549 RepID=A0A7I7L7D5_9MYCO|nr:hypothetical protein MSHO_06740 [Mycobacterium shottsii]